MATNESDSVPTMQPCMGCGERKPGTKGVDYPLCPACLPQYLAPLPVKS